MQKTRTRRLRWVGALVLAALIVAAIVYFPGGLRGPETVASEFFETMMRSPADLPGLRTAGHLGDGDDPHLLIDGLSTRVALDFLHVRERQGVAHNVRVVDRLRPATQRYAVVLEVTERTEGDAPPRRFTVSLQQIENGDWRVNAIGASE